MSKEETEDSAYVKRIEGDSYLWKDSAPFLRTLDFELTHRCNCACQHCCINQPINDPLCKKEELSTQEVQNILDQAAALGCLTVRLTGGEPLLRPDFAEIYRHARRLGMHVILFTNAMLITPQWADLLADIPPLEAVEVSVYGMSPASCDAVTGRTGSFAAARRGIDQLTARQIPFVVKGVLLPETQAELNDFDRWSATLPAMKDPPSLAAFFDLRWLQDDDSKNEQICKLRPNPVEALEYISRNEPQYSEDMRIFCASYAFPPGNRLFTCTAGKTQAAIDPYGRVMMCQAFRHPDAVFSLREGTLKEAMVSFFPRIRERQAENAAYLKRCARCFLKGLCDMCPGKSWSEHGTFDTPVEYHCQIAHAQARYLGYLSDHEQSWDVVDWKKRIETVNEKKRQK